MPPLLALSQLIAVLSVAGVARLRGDRPIQFAGMALTLSWTAGVAGWMFAHHEAAIFAADLSCSFAMTAIWLWAGLERLDLFCAAALQGLKCLLISSRVKIAGEALGAYRFEYNVLQAALLLCLFMAALVCGGRSNEVGSRA